MWAFFVSINIKGNIFLRMTSYILSERSNSEFQKQKTLGSVFNWMYLFNNLHELQPYQETWILDYT